MLSQFSVIYLWVSLTVRLTRKWQLEMFSLWKINWKSVNHVSILQKTLKCHWWTSVTVPNYFLLHSLYKDEKVQLPAKTFVFNLDPTILIISKKSNSEAPWHVLQLFRIKNNFKRYFLFKKCKNSEIMKNFNFKISVKIQNTWLISKKRTPNFSYLEKQKKGKKQCLNRFYWLLAFLMHRKNTQFLINKRFFKSYKNLKDYPNGFFSLCF